MPIHLITGLPGNGKTALMVEHLMEQVKKAERPIFAMGIDGLKPGLANTSVRAQDWNAHDPYGDPTCDCHGTGELHAHVIPDGSLIYIDEAWKFFGHLQDATRQATPRHVLALAEHRHRGIDFVWTTQMPSQIYPFARALIQDHWHTVRRFGTSMIDVYKWGELNEEVKSVAKRENAVKETRTLPSAVFDQYKSATAHTIKSKIPLRVLALPALVIVGLALAYWAYTMLRPEAMAAGMQPAEEGTQAAQAAAAPTKSGTEPRLVTVADHLRAQTPVIAAQPWTAPMYGELKPESMPMIYCMAGGIDTDNPSCRCITEQGTKYHLAFNVCLVAARDGIYNPNKPLERSETASAPVKFDSRSDMFYQ